MHCIRAKRWFLAWKEISARQWEDLQQRRVFHLTYDHAHLSENSPSLSSITAQSSSSITQSNINQPLPKGHVPIPLIPLRHAKYWISPTHSSGSHSLPSFSLVQSSNSFRERNINNESQLTPISAFAPHKNPSREKQNNPFSLSIRVAVETWDSSPSRIVKPAMSPTKLKSNVRTFLLFFLVFYAKKLLLFPSFFFGSANWFVVN